nr:beta-elemene synthase [Chrysanthemum indicum]
MDMLEADTTTQVNMEVVRPLAKFPPSIWGDRFLSFCLDYSILETHAKAMVKPKEELKRMIVDPNMDSNEKLKLINCVYRLGLKYMFSEEIDNQLDKLYKELKIEDYDEADLCTVSLYFQVFRQHGYRLSCDVFNKFKDFSTGKFKEYITRDVKGLLSFYESTQLRIQGETILDEAFAFTEAQLKDVVDTTLEGNLAQQVKHALNFPFHRGIPNAEARLYFSNYEEECLKYDPIPKLANAHFNYCQLRLKEELQILTKWYKDMEFQKISPYARDKLPEMYLVILAVYVEPHYSEARIITTKILQLVLVLDDTFDAYGTIEELRLLTDAINRWEISALEILPEYIKPFYKIILNEYAELEKQAVKEGRANVVNASKQAFQELARAYLREAEWRHSKHVPSFQEYLENGMITSTYDVLVKSGLVGMGEVVTEEALAWHESNPKILQASELIARIHNDVASYKFERKRAPGTTSIDAYVKTFGVPEHVAVDELEKMIENTWKDINEGCLKPTQVSLEMLSRIVNYTRVVYVAYRFNDGITFSNKTAFEDFITLLLETSIPMQH